MAGEQRIGVDGRPDVDVGDAQRRAELHDVAGEPGRDRRTSARVLLPHVRARRAQDELVALDEADRSYVGAEQLRCLGRDLLDDPRRVELGGEERSDPGQMLREPARASLALEQRAALERSLRRVGQVAGEREVVVAERAIMREEDDGHSALGVERDGEQRAEAFLRGRAPGVVEARVRACVRGGHDEATGAAVGQGRREGRDGSEDVFGKLVAAGEPQAVSVRHQHRAEAAAECLRRGLCDGVDRLVERQRLGQGGGDEEETALDPAPPVALLEAGGMLDGERREPGERLDRLAVGPVEPAARIARADAEHAEHLAAHDHRRDEGGLEALVDRIGEVIGDLAVVVRDDRPALAECDAGEPPLARRLEADQRFVEAVDGHAPDHAAIGVVQVAVCGIRVEQFPHLGDEPLQNRVQTQLGGDDLRGLDQRREVIEPYLALPQEPRGVHGEPDLAGDRLGQLDLLGPATVPLRRGGG